MKPEPNLHRNNAVEWLLIGAARAILYPYVLFKSIRSSERRGAANAELEEETSATDEHRFTCSAEIRPSSPSPGMPGEGWGEGSCDEREHFSRARWTQIKRRLFSFSVFICVNLWLIFSLRPSVLSVISAVAFVFKIKE